MIEKTDTTSNRIYVYASRKEMGESAGKEIENKIVELLKKKESIRMVFAAAPSQNEMLDYLASSSLIDWKKITGFHLDEYIGLPPDSPQRFSTYLKHRIFDKVPFKKVHLIDTGKSAEEEKERYSSLLNQAMLDIVCLGIGENGHIAFNDPHVADFNDANMITDVWLDDASRQQQVNDGCFPTMDQVPKQAITLTVPAIMNASHLFCVVPGSSKRKAVQNALHGPIDPSCPASILRTHKSCTFFFDQKAYDQSPG